MLRELVRFLGTPFGPGYDLRRYERSMAFPPVAKPMRPMSDAQWKAVHDA
jgi:hypothetical protein